MANCKCVSRMPVPGPRKLERRPTPSVSLGRLAAGNTAAATAKGASVGQAVIPIPVVGAVIGAIVGALSSFVNSGHKPERAAQAAQDIQALQKLPDNYAGRQITDSQFELINQGLFILGHIHAPSHPENHPSAMGQFWAETKNIAEAVVKAACSAPVGAQLSVQVPASGAAGSTQGAPFTATFQNPGTADARRFAQGALTPALKQRMSAYAPASDAASLDDALTQKYLVLVSDSYLDKYCPPSMQAPPPQAPQPTQNLPVITSGPPPVATVASAPSVTPQTVSASAPSADLQAMVAQLLSNGATQQQAYDATLNHLQASGVAPTAPVQQQVAQAVQSSGSGGGAIALGIAAAIALALALT